MSTLYDLSYKCDFEGVINRVRTNPEEAEFTNGNNWTPLHVLAWKKADLSVVEAVYKAKPKALFVKSKRGETPSMVAESSQAAPEIIAFLQGEEKFIRERVSIYDLAYKCEFKKLKDRLKTNPEEAEFFNGNNWTPLHVLALKRAPLSVVKALYEAYPRAILARSTRGQTPSEVAKSNTAGADVISFLFNEEMAYIKKNLWDFGTLLEESKKSVRVLEEKYTELEQRNDGLEEKNARLEQSQRQLKDEFEIKILDMEEREKQMSEILMKRVDSIEAELKRTKDELGQVKLESERKGKKNKQDADELEERADKMERRHSELKKNFKVSMAGQLAAFDGKVLHLAEKFQNQFNDLSTKNNQNMLISSLETLMSEFRSNQRLSDKGKKNRGSTLVRKVDSNQNILTLRDLNSRQENENKNQRNKNVRNETSNDFGTLESAEECDYSRGSGMRKFQTTLSERSATQSWDANVPALLEQNSSDSSQPTVLTELAWENECEGQMIWGGEHLQ